MADYSKIRIALDGPSGAGKSTIAKKIAEKIGLVYFDTGEVNRFEKNCRRQNYMNLYINT